MTGDVQELEKESFWREHQDTLLRIRQDLVSGKKNRSKFSPAGGVRKKTPNRSPGVKGRQHPPYGKYRRTPSPYLPKLTAQPEVNRTIGHPGRYEGGHPGKYEIVPPVQPKLAFTKPVEDYDSWGEETDDDDDDDDEEEEDSKKRKAKNKKKLQEQKRFKPQPYPSSMPAFLPPQVVYGAPFPVYYPPPPQQTRKSQKQLRRKTDRTRSYHDIHYKRQVLSASQSGRPGAKKQKKKNASIHQSVPVYTTPYPIIPAMSVMFPPTLQEEEEEDEEEEDEMLKSAMTHWKQRPLFASDFVDWMIKEDLEAELIPDLLIDTLNEIRHMPYDHLLYVPSLYACEDLLADQVAELAMDVLRETVAEAANDYLDEKRLQRDPLQDFLTDLIDDAVRSSVRELVRSSVVQLAEDYMETQVATGVIHNLLEDYLDEIGPELLEDAIFDLHAEEFIEKEVIAAEVGEEAEVVAREMIQHYDNKVMRREFREVSQQAQDKLADAVMMEYLLSLMSQQGKLWTEDDHVNKQLDDLILNLGLTQMFNLHKQRDKTLQCKPLHKLHEKVVSDVALDVFLQHLTRSLDEDLADVDEYERGVTDSTSYPFPLLTSFR